MTQTQKPLGLASDHAGFELKQFVKTFLDKHAIPYKDYGTLSTDSCDYPDYAHALARGIESGEVEKGIAICGTGEGISMTLNKHQKVRAGQQTRRCSRRPLLDSRNSQDDSSPQRCQRACPCRKIHHSDSRRTHHRNLPFHPLRRRSSSTKN